MSCLNQMKCQKAWMLTSKMTWRSSLLNMAAYCFSTTAFRTGGLFHYSKIAACYLHIEHSNKWVDYHCFTYPCYTVLWGDHQLSHLQLGFIFILAIMFFNLTIYLHLDSLQVIHLLTYQLAPDTCRYHFYFSLNNLTGFPGVVRWSLDLRWQDYRKSWGFHGIADGIVFRKSCDSDWRPGQKEWDEFLKIARITKFEGQLSDKQAKVW